MPQKSNINNIGLSLRKASEVKPDIPSVQPPAPEPVRLGRKKRLATKRENAITVYCTDEMMHALDEIKYNNRVERQRVVQTALSEFLTRYYSKENSMLNADGFNKVREFEKEIEV